MLVVVGWSRISAEATLRAAPFLLLGISVELLPLYPTCELLLPSLLRLWEASID